MIVFHRTTIEESLRILMFGFRSQENPPRVYVSNREHGQASGYGEACLRIDIPDHLLMLDDEFPDGEQHFAVPEDAINKYGRITNRDNI